MASGTLNTRSATIHSFGNSTAGTVIIVPAFTLQPPASPNRYSRASIFALLITVSAAETGHASTLLNTLRQAGGAAGVALLGSVLGATGASSADLAGYRVAFLAAAGLMLLGAAFSSLVSDADAAPTMAEAVTLAA